MTELRAAQYKEFRAERKYGGVPALEYTPRDSYISDGLFHFPASRRMKFSKLHSRREFLLRTGRVAGLAVVTAGAGFSLHEKQRFPFAETEEAPLVRDLRIKGMAPKLAIVHGGDPAAMTLAALRSIGGMGAFVNKGDTVIVKPNVGWDRIPEQAANTNPEVIRTIVRECLAAGAASVLMTDISCNDPSRCFARSGIALAAGEAGAKVEKPQEARFRKVRMGGSILGKRPVYDAYLTCDKVINVPIAKHHSLSGATLAFKNLMGILGGNRGQLHQDIHTSVADLGNFLRPTLTVMDAFRILRRNGPSGGNLADVEEKRTIIASIDPVAVDAWTGETIFGLTGERLRYLELAEKYGLGTARYADLPREEITL